jgi:hypothetical protein
MTAPSLYLSFRTLGRPFPLAAYFFAPAFTRERMSTGHLPQCSHPFLARRSQLGGISRQSGAGSYWVVETDCMADDAVSCELVSAPNSLLTGK